MEEQRRAIYDIIKTRSVPADLEKFRDALRVSKENPIATARSFYAVPCSGQVVILMFLRHFDNPDNLYMKIFLPGEIDIFGNFGECYMKIKEDILFYTNYQLLGSQDGMNLMLFIDKEHDVQVTITEKIEQYKQSFLQT